MEGPAHERGPVILKRLERSCFDKAREREVGHSDWLAGS